MPNKLRVKRYDNSVIQDFCLGKTPNEVFELMKNEPPEQRIGRSTVYRLYYKWIKEGRPGELEYLGTEEIDGKVLVVYQRKAQ